MIIEEGSGWLALGQLFGRRLVGITTVWKFRPGMRPKFSPVRINVFVQALR